MDTLYFAINSGRYYDLQAYNMQKQHKIIFSKPTVSVNLGTHVLYNSVSSFSMHRYEMIHFNKINK